MRGQGSAGQLDLSTSSSGDGSSLAVATAMLPGVATAPNGAKRHRARRWPFHAFFMVWLSRWRLPQREEPNPPGAGHHKTGHHKKGSPTCRLYTLPTPSWPTGMTAHRCRPRLAATSVGVLSASGPAWTGKDYAMLRAIHGRSRDWYQHERGAATLTADCDAGVILGSHQQDQDRLEREASHGRLAHDGPAESTIGAPEAAALPAHGA